MMSRKQTSAATNPSSSQASRSASHSLTRLLSLPPSSIATKPSTKLISSITTFIASSTCSASLSNRSPCLTLISLNNSNSLVPSISHRLTLFTRTFLIFFLILGSTTLHDIGDTTSITSHSPVHFWHKYRRSHSIIWPLQSFFSPHMSQLHVSCPRDQFPHIISHGIKILKLDIIPWVYLHYASKRIQYAFELNFYAVPE
ncbi:hypothetical protein QR685DRAFT_170599 [Neurospora intermedia]|uniref:Uncharacterized protein n=1 Tax=Neurospora intermedia TaxID=5142 RepID=A0ABR3DLX9_NEUIN